MFIRWPHTKAIENIVKQLLPARLEPLKCRLVLKPSPCWTGALTLFPPTPLPGPPLSLPSHHLPALSASPQRSYGIYSVLLPSNCCIFFLLFVISLVLAKWIFITFCRGNSTGICEDKLLHLHLFWGGISSPPHFHVFNDLLLAFHPKPNLCLLSLLFFIYLWTNCLILCFLSALYTLTGLYFGSRYINRKKYSTKVFRGSCLGFFNWQQHCRTYSKVLNWFMAFLFLNRTTV